MHEKSISIPCYSRSQVRTFMSQVLWNKAALNQDKIFVDPLQTRYVVNICNAFYPCKEQIQNEFEFFYPTEILSQNRRKKIDFKCLKKLSNP